MEAVGTTSCLPRMLAAKSTCGAWKALNDTYVPTTTMEKHQAVQEFDTVQMQEVEDPEGYFTRVDKEAQRLVMIGCSKDNDEVNVHIIQNLSALYSIKKKMFLASSALTRAGIEEMVRNAYMSENSEVGKGKGLANGVDPHALYDGGTQSAGVAGGGKGRRRHGMNKKQQQQAHHHHHHRNHTSRGVVDPSFRWDSVRGQWRLTTRIRKRW